MLNRPKLSVVSTPTVNVRPDASPRARVLLVNPSRSAACTTLARVSWRSWPVPLSAFEAVPIETPARAATSARRATPPGVRGEGAGGGVIAPRRFPSKFPCSGDRQSNRPSGLLAGLPYGMDRS
jgi:hypothetical protein